MKPDPAAPDPISVLLVDDDYAIEGDPNLRRIPVVIPATSSADRDIFQSYGLGTNSSAVKPVSFSGLVDPMTSLSAYWTPAAERAPN